MAARARSRGTVATRPARTRTAGGSLAPSGQVAEIQRARLLAGAVRAVDELGYARASVTDITAKSRVSRRTFYELFSNYDDCLAAVLESAVGRVREQIVAGRLGDLPWREQVREGLWTILSFLDSEPALARVCVVQSARGGQRILERREQLAATLAGIVDQGRRESAAKTECPPLAAEGLVGAAVWIVHTRLSHGKSAQLIDLQGDLMAMILLPYLGPAAARAERRRKAPTPKATHLAQSNGNAADTDGELSGTNADADGSSAAGDPLQGIPMRLTYRTVRVLEAVAAQPGISNRAVGNSAGITDQGQMSKLLARLERYGLLENTGEGHTRGEPNAWHLTAAGRSVAHVVTAGSRRDQVRS
jgi:AcrR family transcriptional regulator